MIRTHDKKTVRLAMALSALMVTGACSDAVYQTVSLEGNKTWRVSAERLLNSSSLILTDANEEKYNPAQAHAFARAKVNAHQTRGRLAYTSKPKKGDIVIASNFRQLTLDNKFDLSGQRFVMVDAAMRPGAGGIPAPISKAVYADNAAFVQYAQAETTAQPVVATVTSPVEERPKIARYASKDLADKAHLAVVNVRMGDYEDKTRLVLDLNAAAKYNYDLNNLSSRLTVHIDGAGWNLETQRYFDNHPLIESYEAAAEKDETTLHIALKKPSRMLMSGFVRPDKTHGHRIFFDVAAL